MQHVRAAGKGGMPAAKTAKILWRCNQTRDFALLNILSTREDGACLYYIALIAQDGEEAKLGGKLRDSTLQKGGHRVSAFTLGAMNIGMAPVEVIESRLRMRTRPISELDDIDELVRIHRARLLRFATYATGDPDLAETITQDTLLRAYNARESFRDESSVKTWLTGIALNVMRDHLRTKKYKFWRQVKTSAIDVNEMASFIAAEGSNPEGQLLAKEKVKRLSKALETLSHNQRTIFLMKFSEEMSVGEISEGLKMPASTVRTHLHRALKAVRSQLGENQ
ncbi:MAG: sigma-70 family RNA polymerase sigma factor [Terracidiphilus sp.]|nr:sigma-70 family RNA polymerase sigma factor [Terracidiphilus sp.]